METGNLSTDIFFVILLSLKQDGEWGHSSSVMCFTNAGKGLKNQAETLENTSSQKVLTFANTQTESVVMAVFLPAISVQLY